MKKNVTYIVVVNKASLFRLENMLQNSNIDFEIRPTPKKISKACTNSIVVDSIYEEEISDLLYLYSDILIDKITTI